MFRILRLFFILFGILNFIVWIVVGYVWVADIYNIRTATTTIAKVMLNQNPVGEVDSEDEVKETSSTNEEPNITNEQSEVLEAVGIDVETLPETVTDSQKQCLEEKIGKERVEAIINGATPTVAEVLSGASCL